MMSNDKEMIELIEKLVEKFYQANMEVMYNPFSRLLKAPRAAIEYSIDNSFDDIIYVDKSFDYVVYTIERIYYNNRRDPYLINREEYKFKSFLKREEYRFKSLEEVFEFYNKKPEESEVPSDMLSYLIEENVTFKIKPDLFRFPSIVVWVNLSKRDSRMKLDSKVTILFEPNDEHLPYVLIEHHGVNSERESELIEILERRFQANVNGFKNLYKDILVK